MEIPIWVYRGEEIKLLIREGGTWCHVVLTTGENRIGANMIIKLFELVELLKLDALMKHCKWCMSSIISVQFLFPN